MTDNAVAAERARIISEIESLVDLHPGGVIVHPSGAREDKAEYVGHLLDTIKHIVKGRDPAQ